MIPGDLTRIAQAQPGDHVRFAFVTVEDATTLWQSDEAVLKGLTKRLQPLIRDPREMADLLSYDLIGKPVVSDGG